MNKKEKFYIDLQKFFESGVLREIYSSDNISICNVSNCCYAAFAYEAYDVLNTPCAFALEAGYLEAVMEDNDNLFRLISNIPDNEMSKHMINCTDKIFNVMKQKKQQTDITGPLISLEYEQELIEKYGKNKSR